MAPPTLVVRKPLPRLASSPETVPDRSATLLLLKGSRFYVYGCKHPNLSNHPLKSSKIALARITSPPPFTGFSVFHLDPPIGIHL